MLITQCQITLLHDCAVLLPFVIKVTVGHFVSDSPRVMTALLVVLPSSFCCGDSSDFIDMGDLYLCTSLESESVASGKLAMSSTT